MYLYQYTLIFIEIIPHYKFIKVCLFFFQDKKKEIFLYFFLFLENETLKYHPMSLIELFFFNFKKTT